jgi:hypothetical protein
MSLSRKTGRVWYRLTSSLRETEKDTLRHSMTDIENIFTQGTYKKRRQWLVEVRLMSYIITIEPRHDKTNIMGL